MVKKLFKIIFLLLLFSFFFLNLNSKDVRALSQISDKISTSWPGINANHTIKFKIHHNIPPGGKIIITPPIDTFNIISGFDYTDIDLATSTEANGYYTDRTLAATSTEQADGVTISVTGAGTSTLENITVTMNSTSGIEAGKYVQIELGTNATYSETGDKQILNASSTGAYRINIQTFDNADEFLERGDTFVVMIEPVYAGAGMLKVRSNGNPSGVLDYGTTQTIMSLNTNYAATCRYDIASGTSYDEMDFEFSYTGNFFHSIMLYGLVNGGVYSYFVRCLDEFSVPDTTDYLISFMVSSQPGEEGEETGTPGGGGHGGGGGGGVGRDRGRDRGDYLPYPPPPGAPGVVLMGWAYPLSEVFILKDGLEEGKALANVAAEFGAFLADLAQGVYTFGVWSQDSEGRRSITYSTTFWIDVGTQTTVSDIFLPPTIELSRNSVSAGEIIEVVGQSVPGDTVEVWFYPQKEGELAETEIIKKTGVTSDVGKWSIFINTGNLANGTYRVKARADLEPVGYSEFSQVLNCAIGGALGEGLCPGGDLNKDGRVNLTDFSILLYYWGTDNACADQNQDGIVNLTDFSIMMYYWTG
jgi:hypothetical protein